MVEQCIHTVSSPKVITIHNCIFNSNSAAAFGGAVYAQENAASYIVQYCLPQQHCDRWWMGWSSVC